MSAAAQPGAFRPGGSLTLNLMRLRTFIALFAVLIFFSFAAPNFLSTANLVLMSKHVALNAFLAIGMTFVIVTGGIDLSVGSIVGLCGMTAGGLILHGIELPVGYTVFFSVYEIVCITLVLGVLIGLLNGLLITRLNVAPFIATLGTLYVARGTALLSSEGATFPNLEGNPALGATGFGFLGAGSFLHLPISIWILVAVALAAAYLARWTPLGRHIFAVGGNERAAALSGIRVTPRRLAADGAGDLSRNRPVSSVTCARFAIGLEYALTRGESTPYNDSGVRSQRTTPQNRRRWLQWRQSRNRNGLGHAR